MITCQGAAGKHRIVIHAENKEAAKRGAMDYLGYTENQILTVEGRDDAR
jgi:hypothetical protein